MLINSVMCECHHFKFNARGTWHVVLKESPPRHYCMHDARSTLGESSPEAGPTAEAHKGKLVQTQGASCASVLGRNVTEGKTGLSLSSLAFVNIMEPLRLAWESPCHLVQPPVHETNNLGWSRAEEGSEARPCLPGAQPGERQQGRRGRAVPPSLRVTTAVGCAEGGCSGVWPAPSSRTGHSVPQLPGAQAAAASQLRTSPAWLKGTEAAPSSRGPRETREDSGPGLNSGHYQDTPSSRSAGD